MLYLGHFTRKVTCLKGLVMIGQHIAHSLCGFLLIMSFTPRYQLRMVDISLRPVISIIGQLLALIRLL